MPPKIALIAYIVLMIWLLKVERRQNAEVSMALWIPTFYFMITASRSISGWLSQGYSGGSIEEGSPIDRIILTSFILIAIFILSRRKIDWNQLFKNNRWLILLYLFLALSILWSGYPYNSFKRWFKIIGVFVVGFMILSEQKPLQALESIFRRSAYILIPLSIVLIKYFPQYGVEFSRHGGDRMGIGVATQKNGLGALCAFLVFFLIWRGFVKWRAGELFKTPSHTVVDTIVIGIGLFLLFGGGASYSATSVLVFLVGITLLFICYRYSNLTKFLVNNFKVVLIISVVFFSLFYSVLLPFVTSALNRRVDLTDRDIIWGKVLDVAKSQPILGTGYGAFWGLDPRSNISTVGGKVYGQSHNGYIDVFLQGGIAGLVFLTLFILEFGGNIRRTININYDWGVFGFCFLLMALLHNYSESSFIRLNLIWAITVFSGVAFSCACLCLRENKNP